MITFCQIIEILNWLCFCFTKWIVSKNLWAKSNHKHGIRELWQPYLQYSFGETIPSFVLSIFKPRLDKEIVSSFFRYEPSPWGRSSKRKGISSLFNSNPFNYVIVMPFDVKLSGFRNNFPPLAIIKTMKSQWKFHPWEASIGINQDHILLVSLSYLLWFRLYKRYKFLLFAKKYRSSCPKDVSHNGIVPQK